MMRESFLVMGCCGPYSWLRQPLDPPDIGEEPAHLLGYVPAILLSHKSTCLQLLLRILIILSEAYHVEQVAAAKSASIIGFERITEGLDHSLTIVGTILCYDLFPDAPTYSKARPYTVCGSM